MHIDEKTLHTIATAALLRTRRAMFRGLPDIVRTVAVTTTLAEIPTETLAPFYWRNIYLRAVTDDVTVIKGPRSDNDVTAGTHGILVTTARVESDWVIREGERIYVKAAANATLVILADDSEPKWPVEG